MELYKLSKDKGAALLDKVEEFRDFYDCSSISREYFKNEDDLIRDLKEEKLYKCLEPDSDG